MCTTTLTFCFHNLNLIILSGAKVRDGGCNRVAKGLYFFFLLHQGKRKYAASQPIIASFRTSPQW